MPYCTQKDLEDTYGVDLVARLADHNNDGIPEQECIDDALTSASAIIDAYLAARYAVPLTVYPVVVTDLCVDIAWYRLAYSRLKQTDEMRQRYEDAIALLTRIADGKAAIGLDSDDDGVSDDQPGTMNARTIYLLRA